MSEFSVKMFFAVCVAAIGSGFQHGFNTAVLNNPSSNIKAWVNASSYNKHGKYLSESELTFVWAEISSIYCLGGIGGGLVSGVLIKKLGPKKSLIVNCIILFVGLTFQSVIQIEMLGFYELLIFGRMIVGVNAGINAGICTIYCCDISPLSLRGTMGSMYQLWITISVLISMALGMHQIMGSKTMWFYLIILPPFIIAIIQFILLILLVPESPKYDLINKGNKDKAQKSLMWLRNPDADINAEMEIIQLENDKIKDLPQIKLGDFCKQAILRKPLIIVIVLMLAQQFSGVNAVVFYSTDIYKKQAGLTEFVAGLANIGFAMVNVLMTVLSVYFVDKVGRKILLIIAFSGLVIITLLFMLCLIFKSYGAWISYMSIVCLYLYIIIFAVGAGSIPWFIVSEMYENNAKPIAQAIGVATNWSANFIVALTFGPVEGVVGNYVFLIYIVFLSLTCVFIVFFIPETKNRTVSEIQQLILEGKATWKSG